MECKLIKNRPTKLPIVIKNRVKEIRCYMRISDNFRELFRMLEITFEDTKVQVGSYTDEYNKKNLFIRNGLKGKAHLIIKKAI